MKVAGAELSAEARVIVRRETSPGPDAIAQWDSLVRCSAGTDVTQLSAWSAIRSRSGFAPLYLLAYHGDTVVGGCLILRRRLFRLLRICYLPYGPLVDQSMREAPQIASALVDQLIRLAQSSAMTVVQPPEGSDLITDRLLANGFRQSDAGIAPAGSYRLDLTRPLSEIRGGFSARLKSWTNRWESRGVTVRKGGEPDLAILSELMVSSAARQGFTPPSLEQLGVIYRELAPLGHAALFIGEVDGRPVAADLVTMLGDTVRGRRCGFDSSGAGGRLSVPAAVRWEIIKWAKSEGYRWLDFGGLPERMLDDMLDRGVRRSEDWPRAHRGKLSFNGQPFRYPPAVELLRPLPVRCAYDLASRNSYGRQFISGVKTGLWVGRSQVFDDVGRSVIVEDIAEAARRSTEPRGVLRDLAESSGVVAQQ